MLIDFIAGTKLDFYKIAPVIEAVQQEQKSGKNIGYRLIYTGRQDDFTEIKNEFSILEIPTPTTFLETTIPNTAEYTATVMVRYDKVLNLGKPDVVMVFGHSTASMACVLTASKHKEIKLAHIEAGMRSYNRYSGDEINRVLIDSVTDYYFPIAQTSSENLRKEGVSDDFIFFVGNPIADFLYKEINAIPQPAIWKLLQLQERKYFLLNIEHSSIIDSLSRFKALLLNIIRVSKNLPIILPVNERSRKAISALGIKAHNLHIIEKISVSETYYLARFAKAVITDTENLQDETTVLQTPCFTLLKSVARPETFTTGYNEIVGLQPEAITGAFHKLFAGEWKKGKIPYLWDGKAAYRIISTLRQLN